jgi:hypothetical protein
MRNLVRALRRDSRGAVGHDDDAPVAPRARRAYEPIG